MSVSFSDAGTRERDITVLLSSQAPTVMLLQERERDITVLLSSQASTVMLLQEREREREIFAGVILYRDRAKRHRFLANL